MRLVTCPSVDKGKLARLQPQRQERWSSRGSKGRLSSHFISGTETMSRLVRLTTLSAFTPASNNLIKLKLRILSRRRIFFRQLIFPLCSASWSRGYSVEECNQAHIW